MYDAIAPSMFPAECCAIPLLRNCAAAGSTSGSGRGDGVLLGVATGNGIEGGKVFAGDGTGADSVADGMATGLGVFCGEGEGRVVAVGVAGGIVGDATGCGGETEGLAVAGGEETDGLAVTGGGVTDGREAVGEGAGVVP